MLERETTAPPHPQLVHVLFNATENFVRGNANAYASEAGQGHRLSAQARHPFCCGERDNSVIDAVAWEVGAHHINAGRHGSRGHWNKNDERRDLFGPLFSLRFEIESNLLALHAL